MFRSVAKFAAVAAVVSFAAMPAMAANPSASSKMKSTNVSKIPNGACCASVNSQCISWCNKPGGCTGNADCNVKKAR